MKEIKINLNKDLRDIHPQVWMILEDYRKGEFTWWEAHKLLTKHGVYLRINDELIDN